MKFYCASREQRLHAPSRFLVAGMPRPSPEVPERLDVLFEAARDAGHEHVTPPEGGLRHMAAVHTPAYLRFLASIHERWRGLPGASDEVVPNVHPDRRAAGYPDSAVGQAGFHMADTSCPIGAGTWQSVQASAGAAAAAALAVRAGEPCAYALCRPPGHHAFADMAGGFCYVNNSALAACALRERHPRVAVVDVDLHHGNGTQGIFYERADVLTVSVHADPASFYPFFWGHASERGAGAGDGFNVNCPLALGAGDAEFLTALDVALEQVRAFAPGALVVALGLDAFAEDPFGGLRVTTDGFARIAERLAALGLPSVLVQEGGYLCDELGANLTSALAGFAGAHRVAVES